MKAVLDHVGIAVADLRAALAFYRDAMGLEVEVPEDVASQRVRAHFMPVGGPGLELLEPTAPRCSASCPRCCGTPRRRPTIATGSRSPCGRSSSAARER